jgi:subtilase family serine protease
VPSPNGWRKLAEIKVPPLAASKNLTPAITTVTGQVDTRNLARGFRVVVDSARQVEELNEENNAATGGAVQSK